MFDLLLESSHRDDSNKRSNIGFGQEIMELAFHARYLELCLNITYEVMFAYYASLLYGSEVRLVKYVLAELFADCAA